MERGRKGEAWREGGDKKTERGVDVSNTKHCAARLLKKITENDQAHISQRR